MTPIANPPQCRIGDRRHRHERSADGFIEKVCRNDGKGSERQQLPEIICAIVEFMVSECHGIRLHQFQQRDLRSAFSDAGYRRALEIVPRVQQDAVGLFRPE